MSQPHALGQTTHSTKPPLDLDERLEELPMLPSVVSRLMAIDPDSDEYFDELLQLAEQDPPFALKILNMANSASSHPSHEITRLSHAIIRIGSRTISGMISAMAVMRVFVPTTDGQRYLWVHAIETAVCCRAIARQHPASRAHAEEAYLAGLLHDIGHFIMFDRTPEELGRIESSHWRTPDDIVAYERRLCGYTHAELGWHIVRHWGLAEILALAIRHHHDYALDHIVPPLTEGTRMLVRIVQLADLLSSIVLRDPALPTWTQDELCERIERSCLRPEFTGHDTTAGEIAGLIEGIQRDSGRLIAELGIFPPGTSIHALS